MTDADAVTKTEAAYRALRRDILDATLLPGAPLKLGAMREHYSIGWTPLREALTRLEAEHLVVSNANKGFSVAPVSLAELADLTDARRQVELALLRESIAHGDETWETALVAAHYRLSRCKPPVDSPEEFAMSDWKERHEAFHLALLAASRSKWLMRFYLQIKDHMNRHHRVLGFAPGVAGARDAVWRDSQTYRVMREALALEPHTDLMNAALERNIEGTIHLMDVHIGLTQNAFAAAEAQSDPAL